MESADAIDRERLLTPLYSFTEADRLAGAKPGTSKRWLNVRIDRDAQNGPVQPPFPSGFADQLALQAVSFTDLVEVAAIRGLRQAGWSLRAIWTLVSNCRELLNVERPLVHLELKIGGAEAFVQIGNELFGVGRNKGMWAWQEVLRPFLTTLEYSSDQLARRWYPLGVDRGVVIDPEFAYGLPVVRGSGIRTETIAERLRTGDGHLQVAEDFNLQPEEIDNAIQFELSRAAA